MTKAPIRLHLITGFLGSGKTSVINSMLYHLRDRKVGLILNDFGSINVDEALVEGSDSVVSSTSLSGGQIFCSCLSGSFIGAVEKMATLDPDIIIVETSGLAKPAPLLEIVSVIHQRTNGRVVYGGMLCIIDAERFDLLFKALKTLEEQIVFSDWFIVNKIDLVSESQLDSTVAKIKALRPLAPIYYTTYGQVSSDIINTLEQEAVGHTPEFTSDASTYRGWGLEGRPKTCIFRPIGDIDRDTLERFLTKVSSQMLRMKGFVPTTGENALLVDVVGPHITLSERKMPQSIQPGVVCIHSALVDPIAVLQETWKQMSNTSAELYTNGTDCEENNEISKE
jgi:G3E family GTPase